jgi:lysophospholipase L1-like esterase
MRSSAPRAVRYSALAVGCIGLAVAATVVAPAFGSPGSTHATHAKAVTHAKSTARPPVVVGSRYLALGDSVPFGYREANSIPPPNFHHASNFVGYPEDVAANLGLILTNAACPGETTASFINAKAQSNGCENSYPKATNPLGYRSVYPLHVKYASKTESQLTFAEKFLEAHPNTRLVTLMIGANDGFICEVKYKDGCIKEFTALQAKITKNATKIFKGLRQTAHYSGQIALVTYWSLNYRVQLENEESQGLNNALIAAGKPFGVEIANGYKQMRLAAKQGNGNPCTAQLVTALSGKAKGTCGVHPSVAGAAVLAQAVERAIKK